MGDEPGPGVSPRTRALPPPPKSPPPPPPAAAVSRYHSLRGKSLSSAQAFDIFCDSDWESSPESLRRRSKSVAALRQLPALSSRHVNVTKPSLTAVERLKLPIESVKESLLRTKGAGRQRDDQGHLDFSDDQDDYDYDYDYDDDDDDDDIDQDDDDQDDEEAEGLLLRDDAIVSINNKQPAPSTPQTNRKDDALLAARLEAETDRILAEQKKLDLARLQAQLESSSPAKSVTSPTPIPSSKSSKRPLLLSLAFLSRGRRNTTTPKKNGIETPSLFTASCTSVDTVSVPLELPPPPPPPPPPSSSPSQRMGFIEQGGRGIVPRTDAPASAINGGQRRVVVRCHSSTLTLSVTADTTAVDVVRLAAEKTNHPAVSASSYAVVECYFMLGIERRLRRYERVRDILNSWDDDEQNSLLLLPREGGLDLGPVSRSQDAPTGFCFQLYHSARPGKWSKRWVTLQDGGQMFASKRAEAGAGDKDSVALCHLSDFDVYSPKESEMRRNLKPPKKFCYAIKSQQKTFVFPNGENFVHFFCTDDDGLAARFHDLVRAWRSWYLVNKVLDLGRDEKPSPPPIYNLLSTGGVGATSKNSNGSDSALPALPGRTLRLPRRPLGPQQSSGREVAPKPQVFARPSTPDADREGSFSATGLLGDAYDKRKLDEAQDRNEAKVEKPFTEGPSLLNGGVVVVSDKNKAVVVAAAAAASDNAKPEPKSWFPSAAEHSARARKENPAPAPLPPFRRPVTADAVGSANRGGGDHKHANPQQQPPPPPPLASPRMDSGAASVSPPSQ
ncbi:ubiquitin-like protein [Ophiocordyceps camponoti-floridani]|uniref:Ubiquitin-like protein n=1 Tax=Ophiocordyceps camponoti-floridani TaxID=2030778 RepID=A0A8H4Q450_9HYPO|nr:ubiquitin-like protein [Ophiocordyceps camponoti-floridani]